MLELNVGVYRICFVVFDLVCGDCCLIKVVIGVETLYLASGCLSCIDIVSSFV